VTTPLPAPRRKSSRVFVRVRVGQVSGEREQAAASDWIVQLLPPVVSVMLPDERVVAADIFDVREKRGSAAAAAGGGG
jgi:hypothetical protein